MYILKHFSKFSTVKMTLCNNNDQNGFLIHQHLLDPSGVVKTLMFQHHPRGQADVNIYTEPKL